MKNKQNKCFFIDTSKLAKVVKGFFKGFGIVFIYECLEEVLEEFIAFGIATIATKALSFFILLIGTQLSKVAIKGIALTLKQVIKQLTYKAGTDKMDKLKLVAKKMLSAIRANKVSLAETFVNGGVWAVLAVLLTLVESIAINVGGFNITPLISIAGFVIIELGFQWEGVDVFLKRIEPKLAKQLELKKAKELAEKEKLEIKEKEKLVAQMKAEKAKAIEAMNAEKKALEKAKADEEARLAKEKEEKELAEWLEKKKKEQLLADENSKKISSPPIA